MRHLTNLFAILSLSFGAVTLFALPAAAQESSEDETFQLVSIGDSPLPVVVDRTDSCEDEVLGGTLTLQTDGVWTLETREQETCADQVEEEREHEDGRYTVEGQSLQFLNDDGEIERDDGDDDDDDLDVDELRTGERTGTELSVLLADGETRLVFRR